jgi:ABC-type transport system involved in multi-copper enzyme maturation permease subunit
MNHLPAIRAIARYTLLEALRSRLVVIVALTVFAAIALAGFLSEVAITESRQIQTALMASFLRWAAVFIVSLTVITSMVREFNDKGFELILSLPLPRAGYYFGKFIGFCAASLVVALAVSVALAMIAPLGQVTMWGASLACELLIVCALSLVCMLTLNQTLPAFTVVAAFYLLSRSLDAIQLIGQGPFADPTSWTQHVMNAIVAGVAALLPSLDRFTDTAWLVYSTADVTALAPIVGQSFVYIVLLISAGLFDLYRKNL